MKIFYSASTGGFFNDSIHTSIPKDAVEISTDEHRGLMARQAEGMKIVPAQDGRPMTVANDPIVPTGDEIKVARAAAYKREADPLFFKAQRGEATMDEWRAKVEEIRARFPDQV